MILKHKGMVWDCVKTVVFAVMLFLFMGMACRIGSTRNQAILDQRMIDFDMRTNEASCVLDGVDPYLVWTGAMRHGSCVPWDFQQAICEHEKIAQRQYVHAYPPWAYSLMMPFALMPRPFSGCVYIMLQYVLLSLMTVVALALGWYCGRGRVWPGVFVAAAFWTAFCQIPACIHYGNFGILVMASVAAALFCHWRNVDALAGVFWTVAFLKPQIAVIFLIPLFCLRKWKTLVVLCVALTGLSLVSSVMCHRSLADMLLCIGDYSKNQFFETGFIPRSVFLDIIRETTVTPHALTTVSAVAGGSICFVLTVVLVKSQRMASGARSLLLAFLPALLLSTVWTASRIHDLSIHAATAAFLAYLALTAKSRRDSLWPVALMLLLMGFPWDAVIDFRVNIFQMTALAVLCFGVLRSCRESVDPVEEVVSCR